MNDEYPDDWPLAAITKIDQLEERLELHRSFFKAWIRAESTRGCYSCCLPHDLRCHKERGFGECNCGRDEMERLAKVLGEINGTT